jgi:hypothetical protein
MELGEDTVLGDSFVADFDSWVGSGPDDFSHPHVATIKMNKRYLIIPSPPLPGFSRLCLNSAAPSYALEIIKPHVPFADHACVVAVSLEQLGQSDPFGFD